MATSGGALLWLICRRPLLLFEEGQYWFCLLRCWCLCRLFGLRCGCCRCLARRCCLLLPLLLLDRAVCAVCGVPLVLHGLVLLLYLCGRVPRRVPAGSFL